MVQCPPDPNRNDQFPFPPFHFIIASLFHLPIMIMKYILSLTDIVLSEDIKFFTEPVCIIF